MGFKATFAPPLATKGRVSPRPHLAGSPPLEVDADPTGHQAPDVRVVGLRAQDQLHGRLVHGPQLVPLDRLQLGKKNVKMLSVDRQ